MVEATPGSVKGVDAEIDIGDDVVNTVVKELSLPRQQCRETRKDSIVTLPDRKESTRIWLHHLLSALDDSVEVAITITMTHSKFALQNFQDLYLHPIAANLRRQCSQALRVFLNSRKDRKEEYTDPVVHGLVVRNSDKRKKSEEVRVQ